MSEDSDIQLQPLLSRGDIVRNNVHQLLSWEKNERKHSANPRTIGEGSPVDV